MTQHVKFPRILHLPWSEAVDEQTDRVMSQSEVERSFAGREVVVTEKMDGENISMYRDGLHARSLDGRHHPSRNRVKAFHASLAHLIPEGWRICGENLYARHSIAYSGLPSYFLAFAAYDAQNRMLPWDAFVRFCGGLGLDHVPLIYRGIYEEEKVRECYTGLSSFGGSVQEGYVIRRAETISWDMHSRHIAKYVRKGHVQTDSQWMHQAVIPNGLAENK
ncbi:MAG: RNA ligase family protein [Verrucomicrobia bacterium]|nr:RNA ligase family protein [Verrucomicrobiota bacterium]MCH8514380.1 RNA ligase family protein [Kiritimatiellia bacterium]